MCFDLFTIGVKIHVKNRSSSKFEMQEKREKNVFKERGNFRRSIHSIDKSDEVETYIVFSDCPTPSPTCPR